MRLPRPWLSTLLAGASLLMATAAPAASLGGAGGGAVLGQRLDFGVLVRLGPGESLTPECLGASVLLGDRILPAPLVRAVIDSHGVERARVRVLTTVPVDEPVVEVELRVGCGSTNTRRYVLLADPPEYTPAVPATPAFAAAPVAVESLPPAPATAAPAAPVAATAVPAAAAATPADPPPPARAAAPAARPRPAAQRAERAQPGSAPARRNAQAPRPRGADPARAAAAPAAAPAPRLQLDLVEPGPLREAEVVEQAIAAVAQAASAARAAASAASAAAARISALEREVERLTAEARTNRDLVAQLRERLAAAERGSGWTLPLMALSVLLALLAAWLAWRLANAERERQQVWRVAAAAQARAATGRDGEVTPSRQPTVPIPVVTSELPPPEAPVRGRPSPAWPPPAPAEPVAPAGAPPLDQDTVPFAVAAPPAPPAAPVRAAAAEGAEPPAQRTLPLPASLRIDEGAARDVSIEELIDLEQQAEFFTVLGQDDAAIELLVEHLRQTGGGSPLPYLKLLEIYHRRGDREHYDRMRARFNHRFNAYAPEWGVDLQGGRSLEDYPGVVPRLQQVWARPLDAMAELEALLFRKSRGELFELPAYREVLFLYALARDLLDRESADSGNVDLLLPLADGSDFGSTTPKPYLGLETESTLSAPMGFDDRPTAPLDFDLTLPDRQNSLFDPLDERPPRT